MAKIVTNDDFLPVLLAIPMLKEVSLHRQKTDNQSKIYIK